MKWELLERLVEIPSPSGFEWELGDFIISYAEKKGYEVRRDVLGNVVVNPRAKKGFSAHIDEVSFVASAGRPVPRGNIPDKYAVYGALQTLEGRTVPLKINNTWKDVEFLSPVEDGEILVWPRSYTDTGEHVMAPGLDNKASVFLLLSLLDSLPDDTGLAFTVQEEGGSHGARALSYWLEWESIIVLDTFPINWEASGHSTRVEMGRGLYFFALGGGSYPHRDLYKLLLGTVKNVAVATFTGGEFRRFHETRPRKTAELLIPIANMHGPYEVVLKSDFEVSIETLKKIIERW